MGRHLVLRYRRGTTRSEKVDRRRLWHRLREPVSSLATLDTVLLLAYATGCAERRTFEQPCFPRLLMQVIRRVRLAARLCAPAHARVTAPDRGICAGGASVAGLTPRRTVARVRRAAGPFVTCSRRRSRRWSRPRKLRRRTRRWGGRCPDGVRTVDLLGSSLGPGLQYPAFKAGSPLGPCPSGRVSGTGMRPVPLALQHQNENDTHSHEEGMRVGDSVRRCPWHAVKPAPSSL